MPWTRRHQDNSFDGLLTALEEEHERLTLRIDHLERQLGQAGESGVNDSGLVWVDDNGLVSSDDDGQATKTALKAKLSQLSDAPRKSERSVRYSRRSSLSSSDGLLQGHRSEEWLAGDEPRAAAVKTGLGGDGGNRLSGGLVTPAADAEAASAEDWEPSHVARDEEPCQVRHGLAPIPPILSGEPIIGDAAEGRASSTSVSRSSGTPSRGLQSIFSAGVGAWGRFSSGEEDRSRMTASGTTGTGRSTVRFDEGSAAMAKFVLSRRSRMVKAVVHSFYFEMCSGMVIFASAVFLAQDANHMATHEGQALPLHTQVNLGFNIFFLCELALRIIADGATFFCNKDWMWNWLDIVLVGSSMVDLIILNVKSLSFAGAGRPLRVVRLLRIVRTVRLFRTLKSIREFRKMLYAIMSTWRTLTCSLLILFFVIFFFALLIVQGVTDHRFQSDGPQHKDLIYMYGSVPDALFTLFAGVTNGWSWNNILDPLAQLHQVYTAAVMIYIALVLFGVMNVVTSVFVESAVTSAQHYRELIIQDKQYAKEVAVMHMKEVFKQMDADGSGEISADEMEYFLTEPGLSCYVDALGVSAENTRMLFRLVDMDGDGQVSLDEFCEGCLRLQGEAKSTDVHTLIYQVRQFLTKWSDFTEYVEKRFAEMAEAMGSPLEAVDPHFYRGSQGTPGVGGLRNSTIFPRHDIRTITSDYNGVNSFSVAPQKTTANVRSDHPVPAQL